MASKSDWEKLKVQGIWRVYFIWRSDIFPLQQLIKWIPLNSQKLVAEMNNTKGIQNNFIKADTWNQDLLAKHIPHLKQA